jgi:hypothetical protein
MTTPATEFAFMRDVGPDFWLGYFDARAETLAPSIEVEVAPSIEGDLLRLAAWRGYQRVERSGEEGRVWLFNLREAPRLSQPLTQWD